MSRPHWETIETRLGESVLTGVERLDLLFRWLRGEASPNCSYVHRVSQQVLTDPMDVNRSSFPLEDALRAHRSVFQEGSEPF